MYKSPAASFLFQMLVGALCVVSISLSGPAWIATLAIIGFRPFILKRKPIPADNEIWQLYYKIGKFSISATALTIIFVYVVFDLFSHSSPIKGLWLLMIPPYFVFIQGVIGLIFTMKKSLP